MKNDLRSLSITKHRGIALCIIFGSIYTFQINSYARGNLETIQTTNGLAGVFKPSAPRTSDTKLNFTPSGQPYLTSNKAYTIPGTKAPITIAIKQPLSKPPIGKALAKLLVKASPIGTAITLASGFSELFSQYGWSQPTLQQTPDGNIKLEYKEFTEDYYRKVGFDCVTCTEMCSNNFSNPGLSGVWRENNMCTCMWTEEQDYYGTTLYVKKYIGGFIQNPNCPPDGKMLDKEASLSELENKFASSDTFPESQITNNGKTTYPASINSPVGKLLEKILNDPDIELGTQSQPAEVTFPNGNPNSTSEPLETKILPDGSVEVTNPDGTKQKITPTSTETLPDGTEIKTFPDGKKIKKLTDGSYETINPDGSKTRLFPDGSEIKTIDGQKQVQTSVNSEGKTVTTTSTNQYTITKNGDTYNITENKTTIINDGETIRTENAEKPIIKEEPEPDLCQKYPNINACQEPKEPKDFCETNPDSIACQKFELDTPTGDIPKQTKTIEYQSADLGFGGGSCPSPLTQTLASGKTITLFDWPKACDYVVTYVKPIFISLATFAALMIIFVGGNRENSI